MASGADVALAKGDAEQALALFFSAALMTARALFDLPRANSPRTWDLLAGNLVALYLKASTREEAIKSLASMADPSPQLRERLEELDPRGLRRADVNAVFLLGAQAGELLKISEGIILDEMFFDQDDLPHLHLWSGQALLEVFTQDGEVCWNLDFAGRSLAAGSSGLEPCQLQEHLPQMLDELRENAWSLEDDQDPWEPW